MCDKSNPLNRGEKAEALILEGYNCAQAVVIAFEDIHGLDRATAAKLASSFGGGMAVSGFSVVVVNT